MASVVKLNIIVKVFGFDELPYVHTLTVPVVSSLPTSLLLIKRSGEETPTVINHVVHKIMKKKYPEFVQRLEKHGLIYHHRLVVAGIKGLVSRN